MSWQLRLLTVALTACSHPTPPQSIALIDHHGGMSAWRALGRVSIEVDIVKMDVQGRPGEPVHWTISFPTSGAADYTGDFGDHSARYLDGVVSAWDASGAPITDPGIIALAGYVLPTFNYIHALPFKLADPGVQLQEADGSLMVTFAENTGETPEDWYRYRIDSDGRMDGVLFEEHHERNPGVFWLDFSEHRLFEGVWMPTRLRYYEGSPEGRLLKEVTVTGVDLKQ